MLLLRLCRSAADREHGSLLIASEPLTEQVREAVKVLWRRCIEELRDSSQFSIQLLCHGLSKGRQLTTSPNPRLRSRIARKVAEPHSQPFLVPLAYCSAKVAAEPGDMLSIPAIPLTIKHPNNVAKFLVAPKRRHLAQSVLPRTARKHPHAAPDRCGQHLYEESTRHSILNTHNQFLNWLINQIAHNLCDSGLISNVNVLADARQ